MKTRRTLVHGGHVVTGDPGLGVIADGQVLIEDGTIIAVGRDLGVTDAEMISAEGGIIAPGMVDTHRHTWQAQLRGCCCNMSLQQYIQGFWADATPSYTPEDVRLGTLVGALEALHCGVTTLLDYAHITNSPEHADAGVEALREANIRAVYAYGLGQANVFAPPQYDRMADFRRIAHSQFSSQDSLVTLGAALSEIGLNPISVNQAQKKLADEHGAVSTAHIAGNWSLPTGIVELYQAGVLDEHFLMSHATTLSDSDWKLCADAGVKISTTPDSELNMGAGKLAINAAMRAGLKPSLGADVVSLNGGDIFSPARQALAYARWADAEPLNNAGRDVWDVSVSAEQAFEWATINGADALGLADRVGSLVPGKQADLIVVGGANVGVRPVNEPVGQLVLQTHPGQVDVVMVAGKVVKRDGKLVGVEFDRLIDQLEESSRAIQERMAVHAKNKPAPPADAVESFQKFVAHNLAS